MNWLDKHQMKIFYGMLGILLVFTVFIGFSVHGKCASQNSGLPYVITSSEYVNGDGYTIDDLQSFYNSRWGEFAPRDFSNSLTLVYDYVENISGVDYNFTRVIIPTSNSSYSIQLSNPYNSFNIFQNSAEITFSNYDYVLFSNWRNNYNDTTLYTGQFFTVRFFFDGYLPKYIVGEYDLGNDENYPVIKDGLVNPTVSGEATEPDLSGDNIGNDKPDIDDYLPDLPSQPSFDNSSLESMVESIYNWLKWEYNAIKGTLEGLISYLADTITYSIQKVIDNIKNSMKNFYDNMKSLFEPLLNGISELLNSITEKVNYITEPIDSQAINDSIEGTNFYGIYSDYQSFFSSFDSVITGTSEPNSLIIPIHLENISTLAQFGVTTQYLDLTQFAEIRSPLRAFCWVFCSFGAIMLVAHSLPDWLKGSSGGGSSSVSGKEG